jgi:hypothetical protein
MAASQPIAASRPMNTHEFNEHIRNWPTCSDENVKKIKEAICASAIFRGLQPIQLSLRPAHQTDEIGNEGIPIPPGYQHFYTCDIIYVVIQEVVQYLVTKKPINPDDPVQFIQIFHTMCEGTRLEKVIPSMGINLARSDTLDMPEYKVYNVDNIAVVISDTNGTITVFEKIAPDIYAGTR